MSCGIYKITNLINNKCYIGQSVNIEHRWSKHLSPEHKYSIHKAFDAYGIENFKFEILEECLRTELNNKEKYWIEFYDSFRNGYNETIGGQNSVPIKLTLEEVEEISTLLKTTNLTNSEIGLKFGVSENTVCGINTGLYWLRDNIDYPIRKSKQQIQNFCEMCGVPISKAAQKCKKCFDKSRRTVERPDKDTLFNLLMEHKGNFSQVGKLFNVSDNSIKKWCKNYDIPCYSSDYKQIQKTDKEKTIKSISCKIGIFSDDKLIRVFDSVSEAAMFVLENQHIQGKKENIITGIRRVANGNRKSAYGYQWKYI